MLVSCTSNSDCAPLTHYSRPILTYGGHACLKPNLCDVDQHAIIHTSKHPPPLHSMQTHNGSVIYEELMRDPIRVISERPVGEKEGDLGEKSRVNLSKIYTVEFGSRVLNIGVVSESHLELLTNNFAPPRRGKSGEISG